jgi:hypothetical protein
MDGTTTTQFNCADCNALYPLIKVEAGPETVDREINCRACGVPLAARDAETEADGSVTLEARLPANSVCLVNSILSTFRWRIQAFERATLGEEQAEERLCAHDVYKFRAARSGTGTLSRGNLDHDWLRPFARVAKLFARGGRFRP